MLYQDRRVEYYCLEFIIQINFKEGGKHIRIIVKARVKILFNSHCCTVGLSIYTHCTLLVVDFIFYYHYLFYKFICYGKDFMMIKKLCHS